MLRRLKQVVNMSDPAYCGSSFPGKMVYRIKRKHCWRKEMASMPTLDLVLSTWAGGIMRVPRRFFVIRHWNEFCSLAVSITLHWSLWWWCWCRMNHGAMFPLHLGAPLYKTIFSLLDQCIKHYKCILLSQKSFYQQALAQRYQLNNKKIF